MLTHYSRTLCGSTRSASANLQLGMLLSFVAGAINAGGFLAVQQYTSHMTGIVSAAADHIVLGAYDIAWAGLAAFVAFLAGAASSALMVSFSRRRHLHSEYALPLLLEATLLLAFGLLGAQLSGVQGSFISATVVLLCFMMGLQNALVTKLSNAEIRSTHITGIATDIGIELGKALYWNRSIAGDSPKVTANAQRLKSSLALAFFFFAGGLVGALGFTHVGYSSTVPLAVALMVLVIAPIKDDMVAVMRRSV